MLRFLTAGESHGMALTGIVEGIPAGLRLAENDITAFLKRRQKSYGRGTRMKKIENDKVIITGGVRRGLTIGSPVSLYIENKDWLNRKNKKMPTKHVPRPGHADLAGVMKYGFDDIQNVIERSSARETAMRTSVGAIAEILLNEFGIDIIGHTIAIGRVKYSAKGLSGKEIRSFVESSPVYCVNPKKSELMCREIDKAKANGDTLGGGFEIIADNVPVGLGSYVQWDRKLEGRLAQAILSIPSVKAVEVGDGFAVSRSPGSKAHDRIIPGKNKIARGSNRAGGIEGGVTNGEPLIIRGYSKPISSLRKPLPSVDLRSKSKTKAPYVRSDVCVVPAISVIAETMVAWVLAEAFVEKFGGDSIKEMQRNYKNYRASLDSRYG